MELYDFLGWESLSFVGSMLGLGKNEYAFEGGMNMASISRSSKKDWIIKGREKETSMKP